MNFPKLQAAIYNDDEEAMHRYDRAFWAAVRASHHVWGLLNQECVEVRNHASAWINESLLNDSDDEEVRRIATKKLALHKKFYPD